jgi:ABC-type transport system involved in multi-copper enzyme maturation permease subunit
MRLVRAELLKARRRQATWVLLIVALVLMAVSYLLIGWGIQSARQYTGDFGSGLGLNVLEFPAQYSTIGQFAFGLGGLLAVVFTAAFVGADWNWGVLRNVVARGESRANYLLAKAAAVAILLAIATLIVFAAGIVMVYVTGFLFDIPVSSPLRGRGVQDLAENLALGFPVLLQRAALGFAVAVLLRSQLAGAVIGIALWVGESFLTTILTAITFAAHFGGGVFGEGGFQPIGPEWYQYLPISIGGNILNVLPGSSATMSAVGGGGIQGLLLKSVPLELAFPAVLVYLGAAILVAIVALNRQEIA